MASNESNSSGSGLQTVPTDTGHRSASGMTLDDLKVAVVESLEGRPNHSCKRNDIGKWVIKHLGVDVRRGPRQEFIKLVHKAVGYLKQANVVVAYVATNPRLKLAPDYAERFTQLKRKYATRARAARQPEAASALFDAVADGVPNVDGGDLVPAVSSIELPDLPETTEYDDAPEDADASGADNVSGEADFPPDDDDERLLDNLTGSQIASGRPPTTVEATVEESRGRTQPDDVLAVLERSLNRRTDVVVERKLNELQVMFDAGGDALQASVTYLALPPVLKVRVLLPFVHNAALPLLQLSGQDRFTGTIGIDADPDRESYLVHAAITTDRRSPDELANAVQQLLLQAVRANEVIGRHK